MTIKYYGDKPPSTYLHTTKYKVTLQDHLVSMTVSRTMDQVSELSIVIDDPGFELIRKIGNPNNGRVETMGLNYIVDSFDLEAGGGAGGIKLNARPRTVRRLKDRRGTLIMNNASPTDFARREVEAAGGRFVGQSSARRKRVAREVQGKNETTGKSDQDKASSWTTIGTLASELGYVFYEDDNTFYFGKPSWIMANSRAGRIKVDMKHSTPSMRPTTLPELHVSLDDPKKIEYSFQMGVEFAVDVRPGTRVDLKNFPLYNQSYLLTSIDHPIYGSASDLSLSLQTPVDPEIQKAST